MLGAVITLGLLAVCSPWLSRLLGRLAGPFMTLVVFGTFVAFASQWSSVLGSTGEPLSESMPWVPGLGVELSFRLDGLSFLFAMLITGIGSLIVLYASDYLKDHPLRHRFYAYLIGFMTSMLGLVTADNGEGVLLLERALAQLERALGGEHPRALSVRYAYGAYHASPERARAILVDTCERYARYHPELVSSWGRCMHILGLVEVELDQSSAAMNTLEALVARLSETGRLRSVRDLAQAQLHRLRGEYEAAEAALVQIIASQVGDQPDAAWWQQRKAAEARLELAALALMRGRHEQAEAILPWVIAVFERITAFNHSARYRRSLERARLLLATALWPSGVARSGVVSEDDRRRARELIQGVERWYRDAGAGYERGLAELERWRRARGLGS
ncbi:MAG: hypothetical protein AAGC55_05845 [Myxococcota bacterium]